MSSAEDLLRAGDLAGARAAIVARVKAAPGDRDARAFMFQLFSILGLWDKAETALTAFVSIAPDAAAFSAVYTALIRSEKDRADVLAGRKPAKLLVAGEPWADAMVEALTLDATGLADEAAAKRDEGLEGAPDTPGTVDGKPVEWLADGDARFGPMLECTLNGAYGFIPFDRIRKLEIQPPEQLRDLVWAAARVTLADSAAIPIYIPVRYPGSHETQDAALLMARETRWSENAHGLAIGEGQRLFTSGADDFGLLDVRLIEFAKG